MEMHEVTAKLKDIKIMVQQLRDILRLDQKKVEIEKMESLMSNPDFWKNQEEARRVSGILANLKKETEKWEMLASDADAAYELSMADEEDKNVDMRVELENAVQELESRLKELEKHALFDEKYDERGAILAFHAGAGGTEAQDWTGMLIRMISRYAEKKGWTVVMLDEHRGQEAGFKSVMIKVEGRYAYGNLKSENGVHRLVRISPFDAEKMRHTSFSLIEVLPELDEVEGIEIDPKDLRIDTFMSGGHGGQSVNTTYSAVRVVHIPTGITVSCQNERSQQQNKAVALSILKSKLLKIKIERQQKEKKELRGEYQSAEWGNQIRSYVLHPYKMVKDLRTRFESSSPDSVLDGDLDPFIEAYLIWKKTGKIF